MKFKLDDKEIQNILEMHAKMKRKPIKEQAATAQPTVSVDKQLQGFLDSGCIPFGTVVKMQSTNPNLQYAIKQESTKTPGKFRYLFIDKRAFVSEGGKFTQLPVNWECVAKPAEDPTKKPMTDDQKDAIARLAKERWVTEPKPSQIALDNKEAEASDLTDPNSILGKTYSRYFPKEQYPKGFFVYRMKVQQEPTPGKAEEIELTGEQCKTAINSLYRHMESPNSVPLSNAQINSYVDVAQKCAEPANRKRFRFGMNKQLEKIARKYGIEIR